MTLLTNTMKATGLALLLLLAPAGFAQSLAITGGRVYVGDGEMIDGGTVLIENGRVVAVGADVAVPAGVRRVEAEGRWVTPGFINSFTELGLVEIGSSTDEASFAGNDVSAAFRVFEAVNPASQLIPVTRTEGVTTVLAAPSGGLISGQAAVLDLAGETMEEMVMVPSVGVVAHLNAGARSAGGGSRAGAIGRLRRVLLDAREYAERRDDYRLGQMQELSASQDDLEALVPVVQGEMPLLVTANRRSDIESALRLAEEFGLELILLRAREAWQVADRLAALGVGVVLDPLDDVPSYDAPSARLDNAALLAEAGVRVAFATFDAHNARNVRQNAGNAVAQGMPWDAALQAVTGGAASVLGLEDEGLLAPGQIANVVLWTGDPFEFSSVAERVFIHGREMPSMTRQRALLERYNLHAQ